VATFGPSLQDDEGFEKKLPSNQGIANQRPQETTPIPKKGFPQNIFRTASSEDSALAIAGFDFPDEVAHIFHPIVKFRVPLPHSIALVAVAASD
jgi:hypothetical protein